MFFPVRALDYSCNNVSDAVPLVIFTFVIFFFFLIKGFGRVQAPTYPVLMTTLYYLIGS